MRKNQEKKLKEPKGDFPEAHKEVNYIYGDPHSYESRQKQKLTAWEVMAVSPANLKYHKWSEVPITFDRSDHPDFVPKPRWYPLIVSPHHQGCQAQPSPHRWRQLPEHSILEDI